jgi:hypothetical protein
MGQSLLLNLEDFVRITNHSEEIISGRYDGKDYDWHPNEYLDVHKVVATHIFGWLDPEKVYTAKDAQEIRERAMLRLAWVQPVHRPDEPEQTLKHALAKLKKVTIEAVPPFPNVRILRPRDAQGQPDDYRMPEFQVIPATEPAPRVTPETPVGGGEQGASSNPVPKPLLPEDPLEHTYRHEVKRVEQNTAPSAPKKKAN